MKSDGHTVFDIEIKDGIIIFKAVTILKQIIHHETYDFQFC